MYRDSAPNLLYRTIGNDETVDVNTFQVPLARGGTLLLCTDGLWGEVGDEEIRRICANAGFEGSVVVDELKRSAPGWGFNVAQLAGRSQAMALEVDDQTFPPRFVEVENLRPRARRNAAQVLDELETRFGRKAGTDQPFAIQLSVTNPTGGGAPTTVATGRCATVLPESGS